MVFNRFYPPEVHSELDMLTHIGGSPSPTGSAKQPQLYHPARDQSHSELEELYGIKAQIDYFKTSHGHYLRNALFAPKRSVKATVTISPGKGETLRVYRRLGTALARRGYKTFVLEPCGQGGSTRLVANPQKIHDPNEFLPHRSNLADFIHVNQKQEPRTQPSILIGHSMGGGFPIPGLARNQFEVDAFLALAPLIETPRAPLAGRASMKCRAYIRLMMMMNRGEDYVMDGHDYVDDRIVTDKNQYTDYLPALMDAKLDWQQGSLLVTGDPTVAWLRSYYKNGDRIMALPAGSIDVPTHIMLASRDTFVSNERTREAARAFSDCKVTEVDAKHALAMGGPEIIAHIVESVEKLCRTVAGRPRPQSRPAMLN